MSQASARAVHVNKNAHQDLKEATFVDDHDEDGGHEEVGGRLRRWCFITETQVDEDTKMEFFNIASSPSTLNYSV